MVAAVEEEEEEIMVMKSEPQTELSRWELPHFKQKIQCNSTIQKETKWRAKSLNSILPRPHGRNTKM